MGQVRSAIHSQSFTSVFCPGTVEIWAALTNSTWKLPSKEVTDRFPVNALTLHRHMRDPMGRQPIVKHREIRSHRVEGSNFFLSLAALSDRYAGRDGVFVNIQSTTPSIDDFHHVFPSPPSPGDAFSTKTLRGVLLRRAGAIAWGAFRRPDSIRCGLDGTEYSPIFGPGDSLRKRNIKRFSWFAGGHVAMRN